MTKIVNIPEVLVRPTTTHKRAASGLVHFPLDGKGGPEYSAFLPSSQRYSSSESSENAPAIGYEDEPLQQFLFMGELSPGINLIAEGGGGSNELGYGDDILSSEDAGRYFQPGLTTHTHYYSGGKAKECTILSGRTEARKAIRSRWMPFPTPPSSWLMRKTSVSSWRRHSSRWMLCVQLVCDLLNGLGNSLLRFDRRLEPSTLEIFRFYRWKRRNVEVSIEKNGLVRGSNPGPLAPKARIIPLDQRATPLWEKA